MKPPDWCIFAVKIESAYNQIMHRINDAIVKDGTLVLCDLPFAEGQHVQVVVAEIPNAPTGRRFISEVRAVLRGCVERYDQPFEPAIPAESWEMLERLSLIPTFGYGGLMMIQS